MEIHLQPLLQNAMVTLRPLTAGDFETLYAAASDPLIWEQHPNKNRWQLPDFENYFKGGLESGGAFLISDSKTGQVIGSSRYYGWNKEAGTINIGYTFIIRRCWGKQYNPSIKSLMLQHIFQFVDTVHFHIGASNRRSQIAMERLGGIKIGEKDLAYYGEASNLNFVYAIAKNEWQRINKKEAQQ